MLLPSFSGCHDWLHERMSCNQNEGDAQETEIVLTLNTHSFW